MEAKTPCANSISSERALGGITRYCARTIAHMKVSGYQSLGTTLFST